MGSSVGLLAGLSLTANLYIVFNVQKLYEKIEAL